MHRVRVTALAGEKQGAETPEIVTRDQRSFRILFLDGAKGGRCRKQRIDPMLGHHAPEGTGVRCADRLAFVEDTGASGQQRRIHDVRVPDYPADVGGGPEDITRLHVIDRAHRPGQRHRVTAVISHHSLRFPGRAGGVEDVKRVRCLDLRARRGLRARQRI